jgi:hypothetical protein
MAVQPQAVKIAMRTVFAVLLLVRLTPSVPQRDSTGHLEPFNCGLLFSREQRKPHETHLCDPKDFSRVLRHSRTVAITVHPGVDEDRVDGIRKHAESLVRGWNRFRLTEDPDTADLVFEVFAFSVGQLDAPERRYPFARVFVWPRGANPRTEDVVWMEKYSGNWIKSDAIAGVLRLLRNDIKDCDKLPNK